VRAALLALIVLAPATARAEPLALRADAFASTAAPVGLVDLSAGGAINDWLRADAIVWMGSSTDDHADVLVIAARARAPKGRGEATLGRFVLSVGALRPLHLDGADVVAHLPYRLSVEAFAGAPVVPAFGSRAWDWLAGGRVSRRLGEWGSAGAAYLEQRDHGELSTQEVGVDAGGALDRRSDATAKLAYDLIAHGVALAELSAMRRMGAWRVEAYGDYRSASHLLPATSLFSVLGDIASEHAGARATWRAAPRLDLDADAGVRDASGVVGADVSARATLRLDDAGHGAVTVELRRETGWTGARVRARVPLCTELTASTELELVRPDDGSRGAWWPWGLAAVGWRRGLWDAGVAIEASSSPEFRYRVDGIARLGRRWEGL
jgi:hypothetical protein